MIPTISTLPTAPTRGDTQATFTSQANTFVAALPTLVTEINAVGDAMESTLTLSLAAQTAAEAAQTAAETAESNTELLEASVIATANFKGKWSDLVGALNKPASVEYGAQIWLLLNNLSNVAASVPSTSNTDWVLAVQPPTSASISVTANSNGITSGNVVELVSDGVQNVQNIYHCEAPTIGSLLTLDGTNNVKDLALSPATSNTCLACWNDDTANLGQLAILTAGSPPTMSAVVATSTNDDVQFSSSALSATAHAISYNAGTNGVTRIATISGTNITLSTAAAITMIASVKSATCALTSSNWFVAYADTNSDCTVALYSSNGTNAPTFVSSGGVNGTNNASYLSLARLGNTDAMLVMQDTSSSNGITARVYGNAFSSTTGNIDGTNNCTFITQSPIDSNHTLCAYNNATTSNGCLAVIQANGTNAPTVISRSVFNTGSAVSCSLSAHSSNLHSLFYKDSNGRGQCSEISIDSNYNITKSQELDVLGSNISGANTVAALSMTQSIVAYQSATGPGKAGTLTLTPTPVHTGQLLGVATSSATNGASATVAIGPIVSGTFTSGSDYYASGAGGLTTNATPVHVGKARSTTEMVLGLRGAPEAGKTQVWEILVPGAFTFTAPQNGKYQIIACGGGGSGFLDTTAGSYVTSGNSGSVVQYTSSMRLADTVVGTIGSGGAARTSSQTGASGTATTVGSYTASGGRGGAGWSATNDYAIANIPNAPSGSALEITGGLGVSYYDGSGHVTCGGVTPLLAKSAAYDTDYFNGTAINGGRGCGGTSKSGAQPSGAGGDGVVRIEHTWGDE